MRNPCLVALLVPCLLLPCTEARIVCGQEPKTGAQAVGEIGILEAVRTTLELHPLLLAQQKQVEISRALKQQSSSDFDPQLQLSAIHDRTNNPLTDAERYSALQSGLAVDNQAFNLTTAAGSYQRLLRSGIAVGPTLEINRYTDNILNTLGANRARIGFEVNVPLRRGKGREVVTAYENSAQIGVEASLYDLNQTMAGLILATATSYWEYVASLQQLAIITGSEERGREFIESIQTLIAADRIPRNEINQVLANFASRTATRISYEGKVAESRNNLAVAMGLPPEQVVTLPQPADSFPDGESATPPVTSPESIRAQIAQALQRRTDFLAAEKRRDAADVLRYSARNGLLSKLDLVLSGGYSGLQEGRRPDEFLISPFTRAHGPDFTFGLRYTFPLGNNLAVGKLAEAEASYDQAVLICSERARVIAGNVANALSAVYSSIHRLRKAGEAVTGYEAALEGEKDKLRLGVGSLTDTLLVEGRLTEVLLDRISAQLAFAVALVQYRYAGGTLISPNQPVQSIERDLFFRLPGGAVSRD